MNTTAQRAIPAPRKDLSKVRKRSRAVSTSAAATISDTRTMDIETLLASLNDDNTLMEFPQQPTETIVNYYTEAPQYPPQPTPPQPAQQPDKKKMKGAREPSLLIRQAYKLANEACVVVGLDSVRNFKSSISIVNDHVTVTIIMNDLISLRSMSIQATVDRHLSEATYFKPLYMNQCVIEPSGDNTITIFNHRIVSDKNWWNKQSVRSENNAVKESQGVLLSVRGWNSLKRHFDCIESYYSICVECSDTVHHLLDRYARFLTKHYRAEAFLAGNIVAVPTTEEGCGKRAVTLNPEFVQRITSDVPLFLQELHERRLPLDNDCSYQQYESTPVRLALLPWLDSEVRRYCTPNLVDTILNNLKFHYIW